MEEKKEKASPFHAEEEVFAILDTRNRWMISLDFEKRHLASRCIVRFIDYRARKVSEVKAVTPRFNIKSTFARHPYGDSDITFMGGGFTASAVARKGRISLIASIPPLVLPDKRQGLKMEVSMRNPIERKSFNCFLSYSSRFESLHASFMDDLKGNITVGDEKYELGEEDHLQGRHVWKRTTFPKRKEKPIGIIYGETEGKEFSLVILSYDNSATLTSVNGTVTYGNVEWKSDGEKIVITNGRDFSLSASVFASIHEIRGPFRKARTFRYATFEGKVEGKTPDFAAGYLEYPDKES